MLKRKEDMSPEELDQVNNNMVPYASERPNEYYAEVGKETMLHPDRYTKKIEAAEQELVKYQKGTDEYKYIQGCIEVMKESMEAWKSKLVNQ